MVQQLFDWLRRWVTEPRGELGRLERAARYAAQVAWHCAGELLRNDASQMAAALTYRTIFSLVPLMVLAVLVFRAFVGFDQLRETLEAHIYDYMGLTTIALPSDSAETSAEQGDGAAAAATPNASGQEPAVAQQTSQQLRASIDKVIRDLTEKISNINQGSIGAAGLALLIWAGLSLVVTVEQSFNKIYHCPHGRPWHARIATYWAIVTLGPVLLLVSLSVAGALTGWAQRWGAGSGTIGLIASLSGLTALLASWLLLFLLYLLMPNARVRPTAALTGAFVAAVMWEASKWGFQLYVKKAVGYSVLYGSLGLIPLFLLWVYLTWWIVLFGLELTYTAQSVAEGHFRKAAEAQAAGRLFDPQWLMPMMVAIGRAFTGGEVSRTEALARELGLPGEVVLRMGGKLEEAGLVRRAVGSDGKYEGYVPALPPQDIPMQRVLELAHRLTLPGDGKPKRGAEWELVEKLYAAQRDKLAGTTLASVLGHA